MGKSLPVGYSILGISVLGLGPLSLHAALSGGFERGARDTHLNQAARVCVTVRAPPGVREDTRKDLVRCLNPPRSVAVSPA